LLYPLGVWVKSKCAPQGQGSPTANIPHRGMLRVGKNFTLVWSVQHIYGCEGVGVQRTGHLWRTRSEREESAEDHAGIRRVLEVAFETSAEADLVDALREDSDHWIQQYSVLGMTAAIPDSEFETLPAAHALVHRCTVGGQPGLMLAPTGVLPQHQGEGAGTSVINAV